MKKLLSVILTVIMLVGCLPVAFADAPIELTGTNNGPLPYTSKTLYVSGTFTNEAGGTLDLSKCTLVINSGATFDNYGTFKKDEATNVIVNEGGHFYNYISFPGSTEKSYTRADGTFDRAEHSITYQYKYLLKSALTSEREHLYYPNYTAAAGADIPVEYNDTIYVVIGAEEGGSPVSYLDTSRIKLTGSEGIIDSADVASYNRSATDGSFIDTLLGGDDDEDSAKKNYRFGVFAITPTSAASYTPVSLKYADVVTLFDIELPSKEGRYAVKTDKGEYGHAILKYGEMLTVTVELDPKYDESEPVIYVGGWGIYPDKDGYYDINAVYADSGKTLIVAGLNEKGVMASNGTVTYGDSPEPVFEYGVRAQFKMSVTGIVENETKQKFTSVLQYLKQIFDVFKEVFESIKEALSGLFGNNG